MLKIKRAKIFLILILLIIFTINYSQIYKTPKLSTINNFVFFYGKGEFDKLKNFDLIVIQPYTLSKEEIENLRKLGKKVIVYITIGESDIEPSEELKDCVLGKNTNWNSWFMDVRCRKWQELLIEKMKTLIREKNYDGFFLDTVDTAVSFPQTKDAMVDFIKKIRETFPELILIQNRGFQLLPYTGDFIDAVLWEDFASGYNFQSGKYEKNTISDKLVQQQKELAQKKGYIILTLNYSDEDDFELINYIKNTCEKYNLLYSITDLYLSKIYDLTKPPKERVYSTDNITQTIIMSKNDKEYLYGDGWQEIENLWGTKVRKCTGWGAGVILTFKEKKDSIFYVTIYDGGIQELALKITTFNGQNWPMIASIPVGDSEIFKTFEVRIKAEEMYDNDPNIPGIQQKFGFQGAKVAFIGYYDKPELLFGKLEISRKKDRINIRIGNAGLKAIEDVEVLVQDHNGTIIYDTKLKSLEKNEMKEIEIRFTKEIPEKIIVIIDPKNLINEITKENNYLTINLK